MEAWVVPLLGGVVIALTGLLLERMVVRVNGRIGSVGQDLSEVVGELTAKLEVANQEIGRLKAQIIQMQAHIDRLEKRLAAYQGDTDNRTLLVGIGTDQSLQVDLLKLRGLEQQGLVKIVRLLPVSRNNLARVIQSFRERGRPIRWVHLSTKVTPDGIKLADGVCGGQQLSDELSEVKVMLLGGCETFDVGEMLPGIPLMCETLERLENDDAMALAGVFWQAVSEGLTPMQVEERCRKRLPPKLMEMVYIRY